MPDYRFISSGRISTPRAETFNEKSIKREMTGSRPNGSMNAFRMQELSS